VAYSKCLPWRTESKSGFAPSVAEKAAKLYAYPLIEELQPKLIIALGKRAEEILLLAGQKLPARLITWNRAQAATPAVLKERAKAAAEILDALRR
jgi:uracil-DNA glycosylase